MLAYFVFLQPDLDGNHHEFVFAISDPVKVETARVILSNPSDGRRRVSGIINPTPAWYNPGWSFHLKPESIDFFELAMEVCDANACWVEENLADIGGAALPGNFWCPWSSLLDREVFPLDPS